MRDGRRPPPAPLLGGAALVADFAALLLPIFDGRPQIASAVIGFPLRAQVANVISVVAVGAVVVIGLVCLARGRTTLAAGVFLGIAALLALRLASILISDIESLRWQGALFLALMAIESASLFAAAAAALRDRPGGA